MAAVVIPFPLARTRPRRGWFTGRAAGFCFGLDGLAELGIFLALPSLPVRFVGGLLNCPVVDS
jgi:hypothetical protein